MYRLTLIAVATALILTCLTAHAQDAGEAAAEIEKALKTKRVDAFFPAQQVFEMNKDLIKADVEASLRTARAFTEFGILKEVLRYQDIPGNCADSAVECLDAAEESMLDDDLNGRWQLGKYMIGAADIYLAEGHGDKAAKLQNRALGHLEAVTAEESAPVPAYIELGRVYGALAAREPPKAEEHIAKAIAVFDKAREKGGDSPELALRVGQAQVSIATMREEELGRNPKDRKLKKKIKQAWEAALEAFQDGLKLNKKDPELKTAYNECLWQVMACNKGKSKSKPIFKTLKTRYRRLQIGIPDSEYWRVKDNKEFKDEDEVFSAYRIDRKEGSSFALHIDRYRWNCNYVNPETNESIGGDNIGGLARRSEREIREYFKDINERIPLRKCRLNRKIPKAEMYCVKGLSGKGNPLEWRAVFFKSSDSQCTYRVLIIADLGMFEDCPYEIEAVMDTIAISERKRR